MNIDRTLSENYASPKRSAGQILREEADIDEPMLSIDFHAIWSSVYRSRLWIAAIIGGCLLLGIAITVLSTPIYRAQATVQIDQEAAKVLGTEDTNATSAVQDSDRFLKTQMDVIRSRSLAQSVAENLNLFDNPDFLEKMNVNPDIQPSPTLTEEEARREPVLQVLQQNLDVSLPLDSRIATISFDSPSARLAAQVANSFAQNYIRNNLQRKFDTSSYSREFLKQQLDEAAIRLANSEREALDYARRTRIIDASNSAPSGENAGSGPKSLVTATLVKLNQDYADALSKRISAQEKWETARGQKLLTLPEVLSNQAIQNLLQQRAVTRAEYEEELQRRKEDFPTVKQAKARLAELDSQIDAIASGIRQTLRGNYQTALEQENALSDQIAKLKSDTLNEQDQAVQLGILQRKTNNDRQLYDMLLSRYNELNAEAGVQANNIQMVDGAQTPSLPIKPNIPLNVALAIIGGIVLAALFVLGREQLFDTIRAPEDVTRKLGLPSLGAIPKMPENFAVQNEVLDPKTSVSEAFSSLRSSLMLASAHGLPKSLMFTSAKQGEGKSSCCFATAIALSRVGKRVLVIDLDLRRPNQHNMVGVKNTKGMSDLLAHNASSADVIQATGHENVFFIPSGGMPPNPSELLAAEGSAKLLRSLEDEYDVVLVDSPPTLGLADAIEIGSITEASIFVMEAGKNQASNTRAAIARLQQSDTILIGVLLTKFDAKEAGYGYEYAYQYSYE